MCKTKRLNTEGLALIEDTFRPMRYQRQKKIAIPFARDVGREWNTFEKSLFDVLGDFAESRGEARPSLGAIAREQRRKVLHAENVEALVILSNYLTPAELQALENVFALAGENMGQVFAKHLNISYQDGLDMSYAWMKNGHPSDRKNTLRRQDPTRFAGVPELYLVNTESQFYRSFFDEALETITSKITRFFKSEAFAVMADGLTNGDTWRAMASQIRRDVGSGALWHWRRLVRTEMAIAYYHSMTERYTEAGVSYVRRSISQGACPLCVSQKGIYQFGQEPSITADSHPNCRCVYVPYYALPPNTTARGPWSPDEVEG